MLKEFIGGRNDVALSRIYSRFLSLYFPVSRGECVCGQGETKAFHGYEDSDREKVISHTAK